MRKTSLFIALMATSILSAYAHGTDKDENKEKGTPVRQAKPNAEAKVGDARGHHYFDGNKVGVGRYKDVVENGVGKREKVGDGELATHNGKQIVYVKPSQNDGGSLANFVGEYDYESFTTEKHGKYLYSDGKDHFLPHITNEKWEMLRSSSSSKSGESANFFIASIDNTRKVNFLKGVTPKDARDAASTLFEKGFYQLVSIEDGKDARFETWKQLDSEKEHLVVLKAPQGCSSIPGFGRHVPRVVAQSQVDSEIETLKTIFDTTRDRVKKALNKASGVKDAVVFVGPARRGKSTLCNLLAGHQLNVIESDDGLCLEAVNPIQGFEIGHGNIAQTQIPAIWYDRNNKRLVIDCPGFGDTNGSLGDIRNAYALHQVLSRLTNVKLVLTVNEEDIRTGGASLFKLFNDLTGYFQDQKALQNCISVVITSQSKLKGDAVQSSFSRLKTQIEAKKQNVDLRPESRQLINFLAEEKNRNRITSIPYPEKEGAYDVKPDSIQNAIGDFKSNFATNQKFNIHIDEKAKSILSKFGEAINNNVISYLKVEGKRKLTDYCLGLMEDHSGSAAYLRNIFKDKKAALEKMLGINDPKSLLNTLGRLIDIEDLTSRAESLDFIEHFKLKNPLDVRLWRQPLQEMIQLIEPLTEEPTFSITSDQLIVEGLCVGLNDVVSKLKPDSKISNIQIKALHTFFGDGNLTRKGVNVSIFAPVWKIVTPITIDLGGLNGKDGNKVTVAGGDGLPGEVGQNGGNFYGRHFEIHGKERLKIHTSGGNGGNGSDGVKGTDGNDQTEVLEVSSSEPYSYHRTPNGNYHEYWRGTWQHYNKPAINGTSGGKGGKGGRGGNAGNKGMILVNEVNIQEGTPNTAKNGGNGKGAKGGLGGLNRRESQGKKVTNRSRYQHWNNGKKGDKVTQYDDNATNFHVTGGEVSPHFIGTRVRAQSGASGENQVANEQRSPCKALTQTEISKQSGQEQFIRSYNIGALNSSQCSFMFVFPDIKLDISSSNQAFASSKAEPLSQRKVGGGTNRNVQHAGQGGENPEDRLNRGVLSNGTILQFEVEVIPGDSNCALTAMRTTRAQANQLLLANISNQEIRPYVNADIFEAIIAGDGLEEMLISQPNIRILRDTYMQNPSEQNRLAIQNISRQDDTYRNFVINYVGNDVARPWLAYRPNSNGQTQHSSMDAIARLQNRGLRIWNENFELVHEYIPQGNQGIHDLIYENGNHFNRLRIINQ
jgi:hypothetical protein